MSKLTEEQRLERNRRMREWRKNNPEKDRKHALRRLDNSKRWQRENKEKANIHHNNWVNKNKEKVYEVNKKWREVNKEFHLGRRRKVQKERREKDPLYKMAQNIRILVSHSFKRGKFDFRKMKKVEEILGCSIPEFINYILSQCPEGITLENFGKFGYHIDHKIPISCAKTGEDVIKLNHYTNLQPMFWRDNIQKSNKIIDNQSNKL